MNSNGVVWLIEKIITSTPNTLRTIMVILLLIGAVVGGLWLLNANLTAGPITITGREPAASPVPCGPDAAAEETSGACRR
jgi:hypothetical protein